MTTCKNREEAIKKDHWKLFTAKLIQQTRSDVLPIYFNGRNGFLFNLFATRLKSQTLKYSSYLHETRKKIGKEIIIYSGSVIKFNEIEEIKDRTSLINYLKMETYNLINQ